MKKIIVAGLITSLVAGCGENTDRYVEWINDEAIRISELNAFNRSFEFKKIAIDDVEVERVDKNFVKFSALVTYEPNADNVYFLKTYSDKGLEIPYDVDHFDWRWCKSDFVPWISEELYGQFEAWRQSVLHAERCGVIRLDLDNADDRLLFQYKVEGTCSDAPPCYKNVKMDCLRHPNDIIDNKHMLGKCVYLELDSNKHRLANARKYFDECQKAIPICQKFMEIYNELKAGQRLIRLKEWRIASMDELEKFVETGDWPRAKNANPDILTEERPRIKKLLSQIQDLKTIIKMALDVKIEPPKI